MQIKNWNNKRFIAYISLTGIVLRIFFLFFFTDLKKDYYWEFGEIGKNMLDGKGYSFYYFAGDKLEYRFNPEASLSPSAYMPPGYVFFLIPFLLIKNIILRNILLYGIQAFISGFCIFLLYKLTKKLISEKAALFAAVIYAILPEFIYASSVAGPTIIYHAIALSILYLIYIYSKAQKKNTFNFRPMHQEKVLDSAKIEECQSERSEESSQLRISNYELRNEKVSKITIFHYPLSIIHYPFFRRLLRSARNDFSPSVIARSVATKQSTLFNRLLRSACNDIQSACNDNLHIISLIGILSATLIYFRPEFFLFLSFIIIYCLTKKRIKHIIILIIIAAGSTSPWLLRNYSTFHSFIPFTTSGGVNFYRGHNPYWQGFWMDKELERKVISISDRHNLELQLNKIYFAQALDYIGKNPLNEITNSFEKIFHLWVIYYHDARSFNPVYLVPWLLLLLFGIFGLSKSPDKKKFIFIYYFLIYHSICTIIFFALLRHQTMMKIALIPLAAAGIEYLLSFLRKRSQP